MGPSLASSLVSPKVHSLTPHDRRAIPATGLLAGPWLGDVGAPGLELRIIAAYGPTPVGTGGHEPFELTILSGRTVDGSAGEGRSIFGRDEDSQRKDEKN